MTRVKVINGQYLKTDDTAPDLRLKCIKDNDVPRDLSSANEVRVVLAEGGNTSTIVVDDDTAGAVTIGGSSGDGSDGIVEYAWSATDTEQALTLVGEVIVTPTAGEQEHYPNRGFFEVYVEEGLV